MNKVLLEAKARKELGRKTNKGRKEGLIPAVVYGRGIDAKNIWVKLLDFKRLIKKSGESTVIDLKIDGKDDRNVLIYETQKDPVRDNYTHIDFFQVRMDEEIETEVELEYVGEAPAVKELGGVLVKNIDAIEVKCLPADLPSGIEVDISSLKTFEDRICIKDLKISSKVEVSIEPETVVALVAPPRSEEEMSQLEQKVEADVTKVEGVVKETAPVEGEEKKEGERKSEKKGK
ncbi:MAG TPA: 50S ribosomal protein L25 [Candidatus Moranbacteria bacterium]|nr:50S ribosomal protein L25 [Candidatus Moranbacteria bacterium]HAT74862.1 50S ribosomal protein L25 [Candidatus Moranbacteria bacterium]